MFKYIFIILIFFSLSHCSIKNPVSVLNIKKDINDNDISKLNFDNEKSFDEFKKDVIKYGKLSDFPKLD
tara:strand:+ start:452 stop:658 length:207 start_codon:yes stop_codon:yes gene_type:complete